MDGHGVEVAEQGELQAHGIGADRLTTMPDAIEASIAIVGD